jgi:glycosyltransferase involved in cell wall biosynthesis
MEKLSVCIITKDEQENVSRCLDSIKWADEILVMDSGSVDQTVQICQEYSCKIVEMPWRGFGPAKKALADTTQNNWILSVDADEVISEELAVRIKEILGKPDFAGYKIKRKSYYFGKLINHCGWNRDYPLRLFNKKYGTFNEKTVHESVQINGRITRLEEPILHFTYPTLHSHVRKMVYYAELSAEQKLKEGKRSSIGKAVLAGFLKFIKMYVLQLGVLDGKVGLLLCLNSAYGVYLKYMILWEKTR